MPNKRWNWPSVLLENVAPCETDHDTHSCCRLLRPLSGFNARQDGARTHPFYRKDLTFEPSWIQYLRAKMQGCSLDGSPNGIPILATLSEAIDHMPDEGGAFVVGLATDGGVLPEHGRIAVARAITHGLDIYCGLHVFLNEDPEFSELARQYQVKLIDVRKPPHRSDLHFYEGRIKRCNRYACSS